MVDVNTIQSVQSVKAAADYSGMVSDKGFKLTKGHQST